LNQTGRATAERSVRPPIARREPASVLDASQLQRLTDWTVQLHGVRDFDALADVTLAAVADLAPCDWPLLGLATDMPSGTRLWRSPQRADWDHFASTAHLHATQDPVYTNRLRLKLDRAGAVSEFTDQASFFNTDLYNQAWRPMGIKWLLSSLNPGVYGYRLNAARASGEDFTTDETLLLNTVARHMDAATARLVRDNAGQLPMSRHRLPIVSCSWIVCDRSGAILRVHEGAIVHLRACLGLQASTTQIPASWLEEFKQRNAGRAPRPQRYNRAARSLTAYIAPIKGTPQEFSVYFVEQGRTTDSLEALLALGLTQREAVVILWITEGKTNPEIGLILGISELTAKKHVENILHKFNVPTRTAAATLAIETIQTRR